MQNGGKKVYPSIDTSTHGSIRKHQHSRSSVTGSILNCCHDVKLSEAPFQKPTSQKTEDLQDEEKYEGNDDEVILVCLLFITVFEDFVISTYGYTFSVLQGVMVPGVIPSNVKPLQSRVQAGVIPRYQQALVRILQSMFTCARANCFLLYLCGTGRIASGARRPTVGAIGLCSGHVHGRHMDAKKLPSSASRAAYCTAGSLYPGPSRADDKGCTGGAGAWTVIVSIHMCMIIIHACMHAPARHESAYPLAGARRMQPRCPIQNVSSLLTLRKGATRHHH